jgi:cyclophilin family peptidyl-prolyl cis-trans isomerase
MSNKRTRERHLAKLAARRKAARRRHARQRWTAIVVAVVVVIFAGYMLWSAFLKGEPTKTASGPTPTPTASGPCSTKVPASAKEKKKTYPKPPANVLEPGKTYTARVQTSCGTFVIQFDRKTAPNTVNSLVFLAQHHFFDGLTFHRTVKDFVIQGGDPKGDGSGGPGYTTLDPPPKDGSYPVGTVAMAKTQTDPPGTAGSQFFVVTNASANAALAPAGQGPQYAIAGHVIKGMDVVQTIAAQPRVGGQADGAPAQKIYILRMTIKAK